MIRTTFCILSLLFTLSLYAQAGEHNSGKHSNDFPKSKEHVQKISHHCWDLSKELRTEPSLNSMMRGQHLTATCFEEQYIKLFLMADISGFNKTKKDLQEQFKKLRLLFIEDIYQDINNIRGISNESILTSSTHYTWLIQDILGDLIYQIHKEHNPEYINGDISEALDYLDQFTP